MPKTTSALSSTTAKRAPEETPADSLRDPLSRKAMTDRLQDDVSGPVRGDWSDDEAPVSLKGPAPSGNSGQVHDDVRVEKRGNSGHVDDEVRVEERDAKEPEREREREEPTRSKRDDRVGRLGSSSALTAG